ncbi:MAG TPA: DNA translocase FtsK 4TM domain-containing protein [Caulobacteraceae bacterium]|nr:DNA translocase FtsK 4TM domain-containing protein [Caulobacteraceae bacterium]
MAAAKIERRAARLSAFVAWTSAPALRVRGAMWTGSAAVLMLSLASYHAADPSLDAGASEAPRNWLGSVGADVADLALQGLGVAAWLAAAGALALGAQRLFSLDLARAPRRGRLAMAVLALGVASGAALLAAAQPPLSWPLATGLGGLAGQGLFAAARDAAAELRAPWPQTLAAAAMALICAPAWLAFMALVRRPAAPAAAERLVRAPTPVEAGDVSRGRAPEPTEISSAAAEGTPSIRQPRASSRQSAREQREEQPTLAFEDKGGFRLPELALLAKPRPRASAIDESALRQNAQVLETVLSEFGVRGNIDQIRPGPVVTLYELVPAPGVKSARVVALADDIARSMSVAACRVCVVSGRNAIGIELPNQRRETVYLRDLLARAEYEKAGQVLPLALGETIGGEPYVADLAKMPHLLIAGTTGSGKSVGVNAMILSILYRLPPDQCRFIMIDPKMLELSVYDGIPHLLAPVVTDPKKAIVALKWSVREMYDRYRRMAKIGVRNIAGYNERAREALGRGEHFVRTVQTGFDDQGRPIFEEETLRPEPMPYLVVVIDEVADLMMMAGKDIESAVQRLAQMARAAGIHLIMATQRPSVDVITGTIKANLPTRISFQVTSKIDSRTIMGEQGAEQLLGQGDMLYMAGGGRITRVHGPFVSDAEVETVAKFLRDQGQPQYLDEITAAPEEDEYDDLSAAGGDGGDDLYDRAVAIVTRDRKASTSYIQRRLQIGYNRAASLIERMEQQGVVGPANHAGKRDVLAAPAP